MSFFNLTFNNNENTEIVDKFIDEYAQWHNTGKKLPIWALLM